MPYKVKFLEQGSVISLWGPISIKDINDLNATLYGSPEFDHHNYQIWDFLNADLSQISVEEVDEPAAMDSASEQSVPKMRVACVVLENHAVNLCLHYKKMIHELGSKWECQLFDSMEDARRWVES